MKRLDVIKIDVEGGEIDVLGGAAGVLAKFRPILICEVLDAATTVWGYDASPDYFYAPESRLRLVRVHSGRLDDAHKIQVEYPQVKNYLAVPREKRGLPALRSLG